MGATFVLRTKVKRARQSSPVGVVMGGTLVKTGTTAPSPAKSEKGSPSKYDSPSPNMLESYLNASTSRSGLSLKIIFKFLTLGTRAGDGGLGREGGGGEAC